MNFLIYDKKMKGYTNQEDFVVGCDGRLYKKGHWYGEDICLPVEKNRYTIEYQFKHSEEK